MTIENENDLTSSQSAPTETPMKDERSTLTLAEQNQLRFLQTMEHRAAQVLQSVLNEANGSPLNPNSNETVAGIMQMSLFSAVIETQMILIELMRTMGMFQPTPAQLAQTPKGVSNDIIDFVQRKMKAERNRNDNPDPTKA